jgi:hypothetical protein
MAVPPGGAVGNETLSDAELLGRYRLLLFGKGAAAKRGDPKAARIGEAALEKVEKAGGRLSNAERLRLRVSWFTRGGVIGGKAFVTELLGAYRTKTKKRACLEPRAFEEGVDAAADAALAADAVPDTWSSLYSMRGGSSL